MNARFVCTVSYILFALYGVSNAADLTQPDSKGADSPTQPKTKPKGPPDWIDLFGTTEGEPVTTGFVFFDGCYLPAPYKVSRFGVGVYVNDRRLPGSPGWPPADSDVDDADPGLPPGLTRKSSFKDLEFKDKPGDSWDRKKGRWFDRHFPPDESRKRSIQYYKDLPFVAKVELDPAPFILKVATYSGEIQYIDIGSEPAYVPPTKAEILKEAERIRTRLETRLQKGDCFFMFTTGGELSFGKAKAAKDLGLMVDVLSSQRKASEKIDLLERMSILPPSAKMFHVLVTKFQASEQLKDRVAQLVQQTGVSPRTLDEVPAEAPIKAQERQKEQILRSKTKK